MPFELPVAEMEALCGPLTEEQREQLVSFGERVIGAAPQVNVVSRRSLDRLGDHFIDSAALLSAFDVTGTSVGDLGSGGGFPGVVLGILRPGLQVALVDSRRSKVVFLKSVLRVLERPNLAVVHARVEDLGGSMSFDTALSRALGKIEETLAPSLALVARAGRLVLFKGPKWPQERELAISIAREHGFVLGKEIDVALPGLERTTTFVEFHVEHRAEKPGAH
jgi:16S rRNA (guanine527-N7)-methyltransferase